MICCLRGRSSKERIRTVSEIGRAFALVVILAFASPVLAGIEDTVHNLSPTGPGKIRSTSPITSVCGFCHAPHSGSTTRGLWSRDLPAQSYKLYESSTAEAQLQQPTGSSRLCLSCHDGTIALGATRQRPDRTLGRLTGITVLGTDLSDDHPISFVYDQDLVARHPGLADPATLPREVKLDDTRQAQCTSCHNAHDNRFGKFLVTNPIHSALCIACHRIPLWGDSAHATSSASSRSGSTTPLPGWGFATVGENGCASCHRSHNAEHPVRLLRANAEEEVCLVCHNGRVAAKDLRRELSKPSAHRVDSYLDVHDPKENPLTMADHVECVDCHSPHQARTTATSGDLPGPLTGASGVDIEGGVRKEATFEYEVCLKCHGTRESSSPAVFRVDDITNVRLKIDPRNASFHPVANAGRNAMIRGLLPPLTAASLIRCTNCHNNDAAARAGGTAPRGPHGSIYTPILVREYKLTGSFAGESFQLYALCYNCHDRTVLYQEDASGFPHRKHVQEAGASCAVCHDAHGSRTNLHLINFMVRDRSGATVVTPASSGKLEYQSLAPGSGQCSLTCHSEDHSPKGYGAAAEAASSSQSGASGTTGGGARVRRPGSSSIPGGPSSPARPR